MGCKLAVFNGKLNNYKPLNQSIESKVGQSKPFNVTLHRIIFYEYHVER